MHETLRRRILRRLETLPEAQLYQVLDYIEFLESRYGSSTPTDATGLQKLAERLEDGMRKRTMNPSTVREAFQLISVADRVLSSVSEAGREILSDLQDEPGNRTERGEADRERYAPLDVPVQPSREAPGDEPERGIEPDRGEGASRP